MTVVVNSQQGAVGAAAATTLGITPTGIVAGRSLILFFGSASGATGSMTAVSDTGGNTWVLPDPPKVGVSGVTNTFMATAYVHNCVAPGTITVTSNSIANRKILLLEVTGLKNATADQAAEDGTAATSLTNVAPSVTTSAPAMAFAVCVRGGTAEPTGVTAGWTASDAGKPDTTAPITRAAWREFNEAGATGTCGFTFALTAQAGLGMIAFLTAIEIPPTAGSPAKARYAAARSFITGIFDNAQVAAPIFDISPVTMPRPFYTGPRSQVINPLDPTTNRFTEPVFLAARSRSVPAYNAPRPLTVSVFDQPPVFGTDFGTVAPDRSAPYYRPPPSWVGPVFDQPAVAFGTDWASVAQGRAVPFFSDVRSWASPVFDQPAATFGTDYASVIASRQVAFYRGSYSYNASAADQPRIDSWTAQFASRSVPYYAGQRAVTISVFAPPPFGSDWASIVESRQQANYRPPPSLLVPVAWGTSVITDQFAPFTQSRNAPEYGAPLARVFIAPVGAPVVPDSYAFSVLSRIVDYYQGQPSLVTPPEFSLNVVAPDTYVAPIRTRIVTISIPSPISRVIMPVSDGVIILSNQGGGGEWVIWQRPDFPGNRPGAWKSFDRPDFKRPSRVEKRGY